jgi:arabinogalactan oligomer/maltooligosaccharide transport system permease protein
MENPKEEAVVEETTPKKGSLFNKFVLPFFKKVGLAIWHFIKGIGLGIAHGFAKAGQGIAHFFVDFGKMFIEGDWATKLSYLIFGFGFFFHGEKTPIDKRNPEGKTFYRVQWLRGLFLLALQAGIILIFIYWGLPYLSKLNLRGLTEYTCSYNKTTKKNECTNGDNTFLILLYSIFVAVLIAVYIVAYFKQIKAVSASEKAMRSGHHLASGVEDIKDLFDKKFYITSLAVPVTGVIIFTIVPIIFMIAIAFTNYDYNHLPPAKVFSWVGWSNFASIFHPSQGTYFGLVFQSVLGWTLEWAFFATITCYLGGLLFALLINDKRTRCPKLWRTLFVITIAVPQFVSLMLIRYFLDDYGIVNGLLNKWGAVNWAKSIGWITTDYFPFFSNPTWIKFMVVIVNMWVGFPYMMLITTGILMNIPADLYESAKIDGAGRTRMFWCITMPYILQVTGPYLISSFVGNINNFNVIYLLTNDYITSDVRFGAVSAKESDLLVTWLFSMTTGNGVKYNMASVIGILVFLVSSVFTLLTFGQTIKGKREERFQ